MFPVVSVETNTTKVVQYIQNARRDGNILTRTNSVGNQICLSKRRERVGPKKAKKRHVGEIFDLLLFASKEDTDLQRQNVARFVFHPETKTKYCT